MPIASSNRLVLRYWTKQARQLYGKMGIYAVYNEAHNCLYIGKSTDLGKRILRFFTPREASSRPRSTKPITFTINGERVSHSNCYVEVTTISNIYHLDRFERTMIDIKKPIYNKLLKYENT